MLSEPPELLAVGRLLLAQTLGRMTGDEAMEEAMDLQLNTGIKKT